MLAEHKTVLFLKYFLSTFLNLSLCVLTNLRLPKNFSLLIGSLAASQSVSSIGNKRLIDKIKLIKASDHILK